MKVVIEYDTDTGLGTCIQGDQAPQQIVVETYEYSVEQTPIYEIGSPQPVTYISDNKMSFTLKGWITLPPVVRETPELTDDDPTEEYEEIEVDPDWADHLWCDCELCFTEG